MNWKRGSMHALWGTVSHLFDDGRARTYAASAEYILTPKIHVPLRTKQVEAKRANANK
jgi:hypothetical protein